MKQTIMKQPVQRILSTLILFGSLILFSSLTSVVASAAENSLTDAEIAEGWLLLFDGESLFGWRPAGKADFRVENGRILATSGDVCLLRSTTQFSDYVLKVDFRAAEGTNSGIFLRTSPQPTQVDRDCYELNIAPPDNPFPTGSLVGREKVSDASAAANEWHTFEVTAQGRQIVVKLDGKPILDYTDSKKLGKGFIGLQHNQGKVEFRNVKLKPLGLNPIFNGSDLAGWKTYPEMESQFTVTEKGWLNVKNGRGQLETNDSFGDFILQLSCYSNGEHLNSGIFFRCVPGSTMDGYESQIQNGFKEDDRTKPIDCGTGGIFRRVNARKVVPNDFEWFNKTIFADGPHISVWVNGFQVTDWTDTRKADPNPRRGLRTEAGTIMIQGHDPTTDLSFRNLKIVEIPSRW